MFNNFHHKRSAIFVFAGVLCFSAAALLLHSFHGEFGRESAGKSSVPVMEDTIDVSGGARQKEATTPLNGEEGEWVIYVTGAVINPGVHSVPQNARIYQALDAAGGFAPNADREAVNLAARLFDGDHIKFPAAGEGGGGRQLGAGSQTSSGAQININAASKHELEDLPGIGPKMAEAIVAHREANGSFARAEDLMLVRGFGPKKYDAIKGMIRVGN